MNIREILGSIGAAAIMTGEVMAAGNALGNNPIDINKLPVAYRSTICPEKNKFPIVNLTKSPRPDPDEGLTLVIPGETVFYSQGQFPASVPLDLSGISINSGHLKIEIYRGEVEGLQITERDKRLLQNEFIYRCS